MKTEIKTEDLQEHIYNNYSKLFRKIAYKYRNNNLMYSYEDIYNECYLTAYKLALNYKSKGEKSSLFGYINKYLEINIHNLISVNQIVKIDRNKMYKEYKKSGESKKIKKVEYEDTSQSKNNYCNEEYNKEEFLKILNINLLEKNISKSECAKLLNFIEKENTTITSGIKKILNKMIY